MIEPRMFPARLLSIGFAALIACSSDERGESSRRQCNNERDDDGDGDIDCADIECAVYAFCDRRDAAGPDGGVDDRGSLDGAACQDGLDLVLSVDVSSSMVDELVRLRDASASIVASARALDPSARISLVVFVDDALAVEGCAPLEADTLAIELDRWRARAPDNRSPIRDIVNQDCAENALDALALAARSCPWRRGAEAVMVHVSDDTFEEWPAVLSGPYGGGIAVVHGYEETAAALTERGIRVVAVTPTGRGERCGAGRSEDVGRGFHTAFGDYAPLPQLTMGMALDLREFEAGTVDLGAELRTVARRGCEPGS